jgi:hypothetical protein
MGREGQRMGEANTGRDQQDWRSDVGPFDATGLEEYGPTGVRPTNGLLQSSSSAKGEAVFRQRRRHSQLQIGTRDDGLHMTNRFLAICLGICYRSRLSSN